MGKNGSCCWDGERGDLVAARKVQVESTAGAGDAFLAGLIAGVDRRAAASAKHSNSQRLPGADSVTVAPHHQQRSRQVDAAQARRRITGRGSQQTVLRLWRNHNERHDAHHAAV